MEWKKVRFVSESLNIGLETLSPLWYETKSVHFAVILQTQV